MDNEAFFGEVWDFYISRRWRLGGRLNILHDNMVRFFCLDTDGVLDYVYICRLCMLFSGVLGERLPDAIHNRMVLGPSNRWVGEYLGNVRGYVRVFWGFSI